MCQRRTCDTDRGECTQPLDTSNERSSMRRRHGATKPPERYTVSDWRERAREGDCPRLTIDSECSHGDGSLLLSLLVTVEGGGCMSFSQALGAVPDGACTQAGLGTSAVSLVSRSRLKDVTRAPSNSASSSSLSAASSWGDEHACEVGCCRAGGESRHTRWLPTMTLMEVPTCQEPPSSLCFLRASVTWAHRLLWLQLISFAFDVTFLVAISRIAP